LLQLSGEFGAGHETQVPIKPLQVGVAEQPQGPAHGDLRTVEQESGNPPATHWRSHQQPGQPVAVGDRGQAQTGNDLAFPGNPPATLSSAAHATALGFIEFVQKRPGHGVEFVEFH